MIKEVQTQYAIEFAMDSPVSVGGMLIYPIQLQDYINYYTAVRVLTLDKANINIMYIKMSYYNFLCHYLTSLGVSENEEDRREAEIYQISLSALFSLALRKKVIVSLEYNKTTKQGKILLYEYDVEKLTQEQKQKQKQNIDIRDLPTIIVPLEDFETIRGVLIYQNDPDYVDYDKYSKDVKELLIQKELNRRNQPSNMTIEDKIDSVMVSTGMSMENIRSLSIRRFNRLFDRIVLKLEYQITKTGLASGFVSLKKGTKLDSWTTTINKDILSQEFSSFEKVKESTQTALGSN